MNRVSLLVVTCYLGALRLLQEPIRRGKDRGDVPGWVMVVVMTAALVLAILIPFRKAIVEAIQNALNSVTNGSQ